MMIRHTERQYLRRFSGVTTFWNIRCPSHGLALDMALRDTYFIISHRNIYCYRIQSRLGKKQDGLHGSLHLRGLSRLIVESGHLHTHLSGQYHFFNLSELESGKGLFSVLFSLYTGKTKRPFASASVCERGTRR